MAFQAHWQDLVVQTFPKQTRNWNLEKDIVIIVLDDEIPNIDTSARQAQVFPAVDFRNVESTEDEIVSDFLSISAKFDINMFRYGPPHLSSVKQVGCSLSHIILWMHIARSNRPFVTVLESDSKLVRPLVQLPDGVDIVFQGYSHCNEPKRDCTGTYGYSITPRYARYLLERALPIDVHVDKYMFMMSRDKNVLMANPKTVVTNGRASTLNHVTDAYTQLLKLTIILIILLVVLTIVFITTITTIIILRRR